MTRTAITLTALGLLAPASPLLARQHEAPPPVDTAGAFRVYTGVGVPATLDDVLVSAAQAQVVFLGESHNDRVGHVLQHLIFARLLSTSQADSGASPVVLSMEMFERDVQYILDEYLADLISRDQFMRSTRPWTYYDEDYAPNVEAARSAGRPVLAANAPRRYVNMVSRSGPESLAALSPQAKRYVAPLPYSGPSLAYRAELEAIMDGHGDAGVRDPAASDNGYFAQSLWDATMAYSIADALLREPDARIVHMVGSFHVKNGTGIPEQLERYRPGTRTLIVYVEPVTEVGSFPGELNGAGDFVILTDEKQVRATQQTGSSGQ